MGGFARLHSLNIYATRAVEGCHDDGPQQLGA